MMKKSLIALAVMAASSTAFAATSNVDLYGQVRMSADHINSSAANSDKWQVADRVSRIGVKGTEDLGGGMSAVWGLEWGVDIDNNGTLGTTTERTDASVLRARNQFIGLKGAFGTVLAGRHDAPYKLAGSADLFGDTAADATSEGTTAITAAATNPVIIGRNGFDTRANQTIAYITPDYSGFHAAVAFIPGEEGAGAAASNDANGLADAWSATLIYKNGPLNASVSQQAFSGSMASTSTATGVDKKGTKFNIGYAMGDVKLGYTYEESNNSYTAGTVKDKGQLASVAYAMGPITLAAQYGKFDDKNSTGDVTTSTIGVVYNLSKRTNTYVGYADIDNQTAADGKVLTIGLNHSF